jgi:hypothetical protein
MRAIFRAAMSLALIVSVAALVLPMRGEAPPPEKSSCCAHLQKQSAPNDCGGHPMKPKQDPQCCAACGVGLALFAAPAAPFIFPPTGEEEFSTRNAREISRADRPPVPPPRALPV